MAMLWPCGSSKFRSPDFLFRKIVFLAIGSCLFFHIYLKVLDGLYSCTLVIFIVIFILIVSF